MGRGKELCGEISSGMMTSHMDASLPQLAVAHIDDLTLLDNVDGSSIFSIALGQLFWIKFLHMGRPPKSDSDQYSYCDEDKQGQRIKAGSVK